MYTFLLIALAVVTVALIVVGMTHVIMLERRSR